MELLEGETLHEWLRRRRGSPARLSPREAMALLRPVLEATAFAHERGVAHRDLKPANIFLTRDPNGGSPIVKVLDFGIAKVLQGDEEASGNTMTSSTMQMFSPQYGAPEQFAAKKTGKYTDVFALGLIMTELCTDRAPLSEDGDRTECMMASLDKRERPSPRAASVDVPPALEATLVRAVALKESERHADAAELLRELTAATDAAISAPDTLQATPQATPPTTQTPPTTARAVATTQPATTQPAATQPATTQPAATAREVATSFSEIVPEFDPRVVTKPAHAEPPGEEERPAVAREPTRAPGDEQPLAHAPHGPGPGFVQPVRQPTSGGTTSTRLVVGAVFGALALLVGAGAVGTAAIGAAKDKANAADAAAIAESLRHWDDSESPVPVSAADPTWGARDAPVTLVVFSDFQCPYCSKAAATLEQLRSDYGPEQLRMVWKNVPLAFHDKARGAAEASAGVFALGGGAAFWSFHDAAFKDQASLGLEAYKKWAVAADVDAAKLEAGLAAHTWAEKVDKDLAAATAVGASGTPTFFVNGVKLVGAQPLEKVKELIDKEVAKANAAIAAGTPKARVYVEMSKANAKDAPPKADEREPEKEDTTTVFKVPVGASPTRGSATAPVTIVEFSDYQCPYCARIEPTLKQLGEKYGSKVRFVWKDQPLAFHNRAMPAAVLAREARAQKGDAGFWKAHDALFLSRNKLEDPDLTELAKTLGLDNYRIQTALSIGKFKADIGADVALAERLGAQGTPTFYVNGRRMIGAQPIEKFVTLIDEELVKANALIAAGTPAANVYETLTRSGVESPEPRAPSDVAAPPASATTTASGLAYRVLRKGAGTTHPGATSKVSVHYDGWTTGGKLFDHSRRHGTEPSSFALGTVIPGWNEGLQLMVAGEKTRFWVPAKLAYGDTPRTGGAPAGMLVFDIELVTIGDSNDPPRLPAGSP